MTLTELVNAVYELTNRPDLTTLTSQTVKSSTLKAHQSDYYPKDLFESGVDFGSSAYFQEFQYREVLPRWRATKFFRKYDAVNSSAGDFFTLITPEQVLDSYKITREDVYYLAGDVFQFRSSSEFQYALMGCYLNPDIADATFTSWVALDHPYAIVYDAASIIFKAIGKDEEAAVYRQLVAEQYAMLRNSNILANGW
jgi:hypothetical protein